jgi:glutaredoxin
MKQMIRVYSFPECPYCKELKEIFIKEGVEYVDINVNLPENSTEFEALAKFTNSRDVPMIKIGKHILVPNVSFFTIKEGAEMTKKFLG